MLKGTTLRRRPYGNEVPSWVDERWVTYGEPERLARVSLGGGEAEVLVPRDGTMVEAISGDACNLYWLETRSQTPDAVLARAVDP